MSAAPYRRPQPVMVIEEDPELTDMIQSLQSNDPVPCQTQEQLDVPFNSVVSSQAIPDVVYGSGAELSPRPSSINPFPSSVQGDPQEDVYAFLQLLKHSHMESNSNRLSGVIFNDRHVLHY
jgi:hypothetical protein